jgi:hypothetical protein
MSDQSQPRTYQWYGSLFHFDGSKIAAAMKQSGKKFPSYGGACLGFGIAFFFGGLIIPGIIPVIDSSIGLNGECGSAYFPANTGNSFANYFVDAVCSRTGILDAYLGWRIPLALIGVALLVLFFVIGYQSRYLVNDYLGVVSPNGTVTIKAPEVIYSDPAYEAARNPNGTDPAVNHSPANVPPNNEPPINEPPDYIKLFQSENGHLPSQEELDLFIAKKQASEPEQ